MTVDASVKDWGEEGEGVKMITLSSPALEVCNNNDHSRPIDIFIAMTLNISDNF